MENGKGALAQQVFGAYYGATILFLILDFLVGFNIRVSFLADLPGWRLTWYGFCGLCFFSIWRFPNWTNVIAATESMLNLAGLILAMDSRVMAPSARVLDTGVPSVSPGEILNFLVSGMAAYLALWLRSRKFKPRI